MQSVCPECSLQLVAQLPACPNCGFPLAMAHPIQASPSQPTSWSHAADIQRNPQSSIVVRNSLIAFFFKTVMILFLLGCVGAVAYFTITSSVKGARESAPMLTLVAFVFVAAPCYYTLRSLLRGISRAPLLTLNHDGISGKLLHGRTIPWNDVTASDMGLNALVISMRSGEKLVFHELFPLSPPLKSISRLIGHRLKTGKFEYPPLGLLAIVGRVILALALLAMVIGGIFIAASQTIPKNEETFTHINEMLALGVVIAGIGSLVAALMLWAIHEGDI